MNLNEWVEVYKDLGFNCIPLKYQSKEPAVPSWKEYQSSKYEGDFKEGQNIAIICGKISNLIVIDLDDKSLASEIFDDWNAKLMKNWINETRRGYHILCTPKDGKFPPNVKLMDSKGRGIDIKSEGGYIVAPPSTHPDGGKYKMVSSGREIVKIDIRGFVAALQKRGFGGGLKKAKLTEVLQGNVGEGARNDSAYVMARYLLNPLEGGLDDADAKIKLIEWNDSNVPPLPREELNRIFDSAHNIPFEVHPAEFNLKTFERNYVARHITVTLHPKTLRENEEIYVYQNGLYVDGGETHIKEMLHRLYYGIPRSEVNELLATIRATTYVTNDDFDTYPELIHLKNCILNVKNLKVFEQTHELLTRNQIQTVYDPDAKCPKIIQFLREVIPEGADLKSLVELLASTLLHKVKLEKAIILVGDQANGKSTLIELLIEVLGAQNISNVALQRLATNRFATSTMVGKILNAYGDLDIDSIEQTGMIKQIISHDHIMVEKKNKNAYPTKIPIRLMYSANHLPDFPNADEAIFRRFWIIKFPIFFPPERRDLQLLAKLTTPEERAGFLNILVKNAHQLLKKEFRFTHFQDLDVTKRLWREKSDSASAWIEMQVLMSPDFKMPTQEFYEYYRTWCIENKEKVLSDRMLFSKLEGSTPARKTILKIAGKTTRVIVGAKPKIIAEEERKQSGQEIL